MQAIKLYERLEKDFIKPELSDDWEQHMGSLSEFVSANFKRRSMGLVCDFAKEINRVYTAVFPSERVLQKILDEDVEDAMLFVHHPAIWDIRKAPQVFQQMNPAMLRKFREKRISIYNLHVPLDNFSEYSTSKTLADALGIKFEKPCSPYYGSLSGVIGKAPCKTVSELAKLFEKAVGHKIKVYKYGSEIIAGGKVGVLAGGGNNLDYLGDIFDAGIKTIVTGITARNPHSEKTHAYEEAHGINVLGGTHYSTEMFACKKMCEYFKKLKLPARFIEDDPVMEDL